MPEKKTAKKKAIKNTPKKERHFGVILENIDSNIHLVIERQDILDRKIDARFDEANKNLDDFKIETRSNFGTLFRFREETQSNFKTIFGYLTRIDDELREIKLEIKALKGELVKKADLSRIESLEKRVAKMEITLQKKLANA